MPTVLIADDDPAILEVLRAYFVREDWTVLDAQDGLTARALLPRADVAVLDWMMPAPTGLEIAQLVRRELPSLPVLLLTARDEEEALLRALEAGADDYVTKPFSPREVVARIKVLLRRAGVQDVHHVGALHIDARRRQVQLRGEALHLSRLEFNLLLTLAQHPGLVWPRERLLERVWGADFSGVDRVVDVHITSLRRKLGDDADVPAYIETVRGVGYRFREHPDQMDEEHSP